jgi:hypothetical protein
MISSWDETKQRSNYHFDNKKFDPAQDRVIRLGVIPPSWQQELPSIIENSQSATWRTRGAAGKSRPESELAAEEHDLEREGYRADYVITNLNWSIPSVLQNIADQFALDDVMVRIHVQQPGQVWNYHLDKLEKWNPEDPDSVLRVQIQLTDWQPGQFWNYGNYCHSMWVAGDVTTFDWQNIPHATANASHHARVTMQITGIITDETCKFLSKLAESATPLEV